jgi:hypothetical protein
MNQRLSYSEAAPAVYKPCWRCRPLSINPVSKKTCVPAHFTSQEVNAPDANFHMTSNLSINSKSRTSRAQFTFGRNGTYQRPTGTTSSLSWVEDGRVRRKMTQILLDESAPGRLTPRALLRFRTTRIAWPYKFEKENTSVHTRRHCGACDFGAWKSTRQASSQEVT